MPRPPHAQKKNGDAPGKKTGKKKSALKKPLSKAAAPKNIAPLRSSRIGLFEADLQLGTLRWSGNCGQMFGIKAKSSLPGNIRTLVQSVHALDQHALEDALSECTSCERDLLLEARMITPDGSYRWIEFSGQVEKRKSSVCLHGIVQDVTVKKLTEFELYDWKTRNELVSESAGLLIYDYDLATGEILWSGSTQQIVGFSPKEMGRIEAWEDLIHPEDRDDAFRALEYAKDQLKPYDVYYRFRRRNNGYCYMHDRGQFIPNRGGKAIRMLGVMNDVSERVTADRIIKQSEKSYRELFDSVGEAICIQKPDGTFLDVNKATCTIYGYSKEELIGKNPSFIASPGKNDVGSVLRKMEAASKGEVQSYQWHGLKKNGQSCVMEVRLTKGTYFGEDCIIATSWDITEKIAAEVSLQESERRFRRLIGDLNVGVILQGSRGDIQMANAAALGLLGVSEQSLLEKTLSHYEWNFITEDAEPLTTHELPWNLAGHMRKSVRAVVVGIRSKHDSLVWVLVNAEPILLNDRELLYVVVSFTDITERKKAEEDLRESELRFRTLQEASFGGIGLHNQGQIIDCNQGLCDITGYSYEELIGSNGLSLIAPEFRDFVYNQIINKVEHPYDVEGVRKDGSRYYLAIQGKNIPYLEGLIRVTEFRDITDRKATESKILEQNAKLISITEDLKIRNEQLQEFTQIVSHNLRSPVGNILSLLNFVENAESQEEHNEYVVLLKEAGATTLTTLNELNDVLQIKQNKNIERQKLVFEQVFSNVRRMLTAKIVETNAEILTDFSAAPGIEYPNIYLESIFLNLLSNALKYHHSDRKPVIHIKTSTQNGAIQLTVADNGQGINMHRYGHHIFKLRKTFHKHPESRGIGLFMIKNQIDAMGGEISVSSVENEGTTFLINFNSKRPDHEY